MSTRSLFLEGLQPLPHSPATTSLWHSICQPPWVRIHSGASPSYLRTHSPAVFLPRPFQVYIITLSPTHTLGLLLPYPCPALSADSDLPGLPCHHQSLSPPLPQHSSQGEFSCSKRSLACLAPTIASQLSPSGPQLSSAPFPDLSARPCHSQHCPCIGFILTL